MTDAQCVAILVAVARAAQATQEIIIQTSGGVVGTKPTIEETYRDSIAMFESIKGAPVDETVMK